MRSSHFEDPCSRLSSCPPLLRRATTQLLPFFPRLLRNSLYLLFSSHLHPQSLFHIPHHPLSASDSPQPTVITDPVSERQTHQINHNHGIPSTANPSPHQPHPAPSATPTSPASPPQTLKLPPPPTPPTPSQSCSVDPHLRHQFSSLYSRCSSTSCVSVFVSVVSG